MGKTCFGVIVGNIPPIQGMVLGVYDEGSVFSYLYYGVSKGIYPPLIFLGIGAMTDFSALLSNPKLVLLGAAAQIGIFLTFIGALYLGFTSAQAGAIGIIGGAGYTEKIGSGGSSWNCPGKPRAWLHRVRRGHRWCVRFWSCPSIFCPCNCRTVAVSD